MPSGEGLSFLWDLEGGGEGGSLASQLGTVRGQSPKGTGPETSPPVCNCPLCLPFPPEALAQLFRGTPTPPKN